MESFPVRKKSITKQILINLGILVSSLICSFLFVNVFLNFLASQWYYDLDTQIIGDETELLYNLGKLFQLFGLIVAIGLSSLIVIAFFRNIRQKNFSRFAQFSIAWFFIILGVITGFTFFFPEGTGVLADREFYWRAAFPFAIIGVGFSILMTTEVIESQKKGKKLILWLVMLTLLSLGIFTTISYDKIHPWGQDANHPWMLSLSLGAHYLVTFWIIGMSFVLLTIKIRFYMAWNDLINISACCSSLITFIVAFPPFIPRGVTYIELYRYFAVILILGAISMLLWSINEIIKQKLDGNK
ncbi:MAG: hypothetical protein ACFFB2_19755 [Promethearchaeota archaeon]